MCNGADKIFMIQREDDNCMSYSRVISRDISKHAQACISYSMLWKGNRYPTVTTNAVFITDTDSNQLMHPNLGTKLLLPLQCCLLTNKQKVKLFEVAPFGSSSQPNHVSLTVN